MALKKGKDNQEEELTLDFSSPSECIQYYYNEQDIEKRHLALDKLKDLQDGVYEYVNLLKDEGLEQEEHSYIGMLLSSLEPKKAPIDEIMELLKIDNAYVRNLAISILQEYGEEIKYYIVKYLIGNDRDLRIFAINVLGDVKFPESHDMLIELLESEKDINVAMTAVDYLAEIGKQEDIPLLEGLKKRFENNSYVEFCVNRTIEMIKG